MKNKKTSDILKEILNGLNYKLFKEKTDRIVNEYYLLSYDEIDEMLSEINYFTSMFINYQQTIKDEKNGWLKVVAEVGAIKFEFSNYPLAKLKLGIVHQVKKYYLKNKEVIPEVLVVSLNEKELKIAIAISNIGLKTIQNIEKQKQIALKKEKKRIADREQRLNNALKNK